MPILLSEQDVRMVLSMDDLIPAMEAALVQFSTGQVKQPLRSVIEVGAHKGFFGVMPALTSEPAVIGTKLVTVFHGNATRDLPSHLASIVLMDSETGELLAFMDGRYITEARTAAVSAVSAKLLAKADAGALAIIGSGVQARSHLEALKRVRTLEKVRVWSPNEVRLAGSRADPAQDDRPSDRHAFGAGGRRGRTSSCSRPRRASRSSRARGSRRARTSAPLAPAVRISARWTRR